jgi:hypothetical protein
MDAPLSLSVRLTQPPSGSSPDVLATISLSSESQGSTHTGDVLIAPLTEEEEKNIRWYLEEYWLWPYEQFRERAEAVEELLPRLGKKMYDALFGSVGAQQVLQAWRLQPASQRQISIVSDIPRVLSLPWELLHDEQGFLALRERLTDPKRPPVHILHFDGHGAFGQEPIAKDDKRFKSGGPLQGLLAFEDEKDKEHLVSAEELAEVLQHSGIRLAVFNSRHFQHEEGEPVELRDWWVPHYYQQRYHARRTALRLQWACA